jgi:hypothetical protein
VAAMGLPVACVARDVAGARAGPRKCAGGLPLVGPLVDRIHHRAAALHYVIEKLHVSQRLAIGKAQHASAGKK